MGLLERGIAKGQKMPEQEQPKEIKWVYTMSVPPEEGEPNIEIVIGVPQDHETTGWYLPTGSEEQNLNYHINVPLNVIIGGQRIECVAKGTVLGDIGGQRFNLASIEAKQDLPAGGAETIGKTYEWIINPAANETVRQVLGREIERQCRNYFHQQRADN